MQGAAIVRFTPELSQWDPETFVRTVLVDWLRVSEVWVGANFLFGHDRAGNFSMLRDARRALRVQGREDRSGALQGLRGQQHADSPAGQRRARGRGGRAARPRVLPRRHGRARAISAAATIGFPTANLCTDNELLPPHGVYATTATIDGIVYAVGDQCRRAADGRRVRAR